VYTSYLFKVNLQIIQGLHKNEIPLNYRMMKLSEKCPVKVIMVAIVVANKK